MITIPTPTEYADLTFERRQAVIERLRTLLWEYEAAS